MTAERFLLLDALGGATPWYTLTLRKSSISHRKELGVLIY
jgi:hypothetical protein